MNKLRKKIRAFTLLEMLVTLTLTTLIVTMAYFAYSYLLQGFICYRRLNDRMSQHYTFKTYLERALMGSREIARTAGGLKFTAYDGSARALEIKEGYVLFLKDSQPVDTLKMEVSDGRFYWKADSVLPDKSPVQKIKLNIRFTGQSHTLIFEKPYDAETLIRLDSVYHSLK